MKKHRIFFHAFPWQKKTWIIDEQLKAIFDSGILSVADLTVCAVVTKFLEGYNFPDWVGDIVEVDHTGTEWPTLKILHDWASVNDSPDQQSLYIHTKGSIKARMHGCNHTWRQMMVYFLVERWRDCLHLFERHDEIGAMGCHLKNKQPRGKYRRPGKGPFELWHFAGNYWWGRNSHLKNLPVPGSPEAISIDTWQGVKPRLAAERWIGEIGKDHLHSIHRPKVNINMVPYTRDLYEGTELIPFA